MSEINQDEFVALFNFVPIQQAFKIAKYIDNLVDQEKRSTAIAFHIWVDQNNFPLFSGLTIEEMYDLYLQSLPKTV